MYCFYTNTSQKDLYCRYKSIVIVNKVTVAMRTAKIFNFN